MHVDDVVSTPFRVSFATQTDGLSGEGMNEKPKKERVMKCCIRKKQQPKH